MKLRKLQISGFYRDVDLVGDEVNITDDVTDEINKIQGVEPNYGDSTMIEKYMKYTP